MQQLVLKQRKSHPTYMTKVTKNNIKISYLHVVEYIKPFTNDNKKAPREDKPITIHQNSSINAPIHPLEKNVKFSKEESDPTQNDDEK